MGQLDFSACNVGVTSGVGLVGVCVWGGGGGEGSKCRQRVNVESCWDKQAGSRRAGNG